MDAQARREYNFMFAGEKQIPMTFAPSSES